MSPLPWPPGFLLLLILLFLKNFATANMNPSPTTRSRRCEAAAIINPTPNPRSSLDSQNNDQVETMGEDLTLISDKRPFRIGD